MKTPAFEGGGRGTDDTVRQAHTVTLSFTLLGVTPVAFGSKRAIGAIEIAGFGIIDVEYFKPTSRPAFAETLSIRNRYTGQYERVIELDADFALKLLEAIEDRLAAEEGASPGGAD